MRSVPQSRHAAAMLILVGFAVIFGSLGIFDDRLSEVQVHLTCAVLKQNEPSLYPNDTVFSDPRSARFFSPIMRMILAPTLRLVGEDNPILVFRLLTGVVVFVYLTGMYFLAHRQCRIWSVSVFVAVLSCAVIPVPGKSHWGIGSLSSITPMGLCIALAPWGLLAMFRFERGWGLFPVFALVGAMGNLHFAMGMTLTVVLMIAYLGRRGFALRAFPKALLCGLIGLGTGSYYVICYHQLRHSLDPLVSVVSAPALDHALHQLKLLSSDVFKSLLEWDFLGRLLGLGIAATAVLLRIERYRVRDRGTWICILISAAAFPLIIYAIGRFLNSHHPVPLMHEFAGVLGLVFLPLYVLLGQGLTNLFRLSGRHRNALRWACVGLALGWGLPSDNLRIARHAAYNAYDEGARRVAGLSKFKVRKHQVHERRMAELGAMGQWAKNQSDPGAVFLTDRCEFRAFSQRGILTCPAELRYLYHMRRGELERWRDLFNRQKLLLHPGTGSPNARALQQFVTELSKQQRWNKVPQWYAIVPVRGTANVPGSYQEIQSKDWGKYYRMLRIR